jgi:AcrR family transcriptional regulator
VTVTRQAVLDRARDLFNEFGLEGVGVRDLARDLGLSPGNVSYYFPRKQDLIDALMAELAERQAANVAGLGDAEGLAGLLQRYRRTFEAQYDYRCLARALVHIVDAYPELAERYRGVELDRRRGLTRALGALIGGDLRADTDTATLARLVGTFTLVARFWSSEAHVSFPDRAPHEVIDHYLSLIAHALWGPATSRGRRSLRPFLRDELADTVLGR